MKLVTFAYKDITHIGLLQGKDSDLRVLDLNLLDPTLPTDMLQFLENGEAAREQALSALSANREFPDFPLRKIRLKAPLPRPGKILCVGLNYREHAEESEFAVPDTPIIFAKYYNCVIGPYDPIVIPRITDQVDWEGELGVVIGKAGKYIPESKALDYVGGYVVFNDVSERDYQFRTSQWTIGKSFDTFGPMGPSLVTSDEIPNPADLNLVTRVNGEVKQMSNTSCLIFNVPYLISYISSVMTLQPGDLISTGTPAGVGFSRSPKQFLRPGDVVHIEIDRIGSLENPVIAEV
jgi:acylpyruvate hydrolase